MKGKSFYSSVGQPRPMLRMGSPVASFVLLKTAGLKPCPTGGAGHPRQAAWVGVRGFRREDTPKHQRARQNDSGFTLVEILVALALTALFTIAVYSVYDMFYRQTACQQIKLETQQNVRAAIELMQQELLLAGYMVPFSVQAIQGQSANAITFLYADPATDNNQPTRVSYMISGADNRILQKNKCNDTPTFTGCFGNWVTVLDNLDTAAVPGPLNLEYFDSTGNVAATAGVIRFAKVTINAAARERCAGATMPERITLSTEVRLRNLEVQSGSSGDTTPPAKPTGLAVREDTIGGRTGICGRLRLRWDIGLEADLGYYTIYYSSGAGAERSVRVPLADLTSVGGQYEYTLAPGQTEGNWILAHTPSSGGGAVTYTIGIRAFDTSHNESAILEVTGDLSTATLAGSNGTFGAGANDTTINPSKPTPVTGFTGIDGTSDGQVDLSWNPYDLVSNPDVVGFRVYRSEASFAYPIDHASFNRATEATLNKNKTVFTDGPGLIGCKAYHYAVAPVNCDTTLIPNDAGDTAQAMYVAANYAEAYGDGADNPIGDSPGGADTAPPDSIGIGAGDPGYPYPSLTARPGWKRVSMNLTNPIIEGGEYVDPDFTNTFIAFNRYPGSAVQCPVPSCYPADIDKDGNVTDGTRIPDKNITDGSAVISGKFTFPGSGGGNNFYFDSETLESPPGEPQLFNECPPGSGITCTYYFTAISFDRCGNQSQVRANAQPLSTLCGDDPAALGAPPAPMGLSAQACGSPVTLSWDDQSALIDFAGYVVDRNASVITGTTNYPVINNYPNTYWPNNAACPGGCNKPWFSDATVTEGNTYIYELRSMDCAYANDPLESILQWQANISAYSASVTVSPGMLDRDERTNWDKDAHREVLSGVTVDDIWGEPETMTILSTGSYPIFMHDTVTLFFNNTSAGSMTIEKVSSVSWVNSDAILKEIAIGGGKSSLARVPAVPTNNVAPSLSAAASPYTWTQSEVDIADVTIPALERYVPITFRFEDSLGKKVEMRDDQIRVELKVRNDSTMTSNCANYLTVSKAFEGVSVPIGPSLSAVQQQFGWGWCPGSTTLSAHAVPGPTGNNFVVSGVDGPVIVESNVWVTISGIIASNTIDASTGNKVGIKDVRLYYIATDKTVTEPPSSGYTYCQWCLWWWNNTFSAWMDPQNGKRVWYFIVAEDWDGNFDISPEPVMKNGEWVLNAYVYDQKTFDVCGVTPDGDTISWWWPYPQAAGNTVNLRWYQPWQYTNCAWLDSWSNPMPDPLTYDVQRYNATTSAWDTIKTDQTCVWMDVWGGGWFQWVCEYTDDNSGAGLADGIYSYRVMAKNSCPVASGGPKISSWSMSASSCVGSSTGASIETYTWPDAGRIEAGNWFSVKVLDCQAITGGYALTQDIINGPDPIFGGFNIISSVGGDTDSPQSWESGVNTGEFWQWAQTTTDPTWPDDWALLVANTDTITIEYPDALPKTIIVSPNPCSNTPKAPTGLTITLQDTNNVSLEWTEPTLNTDGITSIDDLSGYYVCEKICDSDACGTVHSVTSAECGEPGWQLKKTVAAADPSPVGTEVSGVLYRTLPNYNTKTYWFKVRAFDSCPNTSADSGIVQETR